MISPVSEADYNYANFDLGDDEIGEFECFPNHLRVGDTAPDLTLTDAETGSEVRLSSLWKRQHLLMEFGSFT
jgi:hypothetical protein